MYIGVWSLFHAAGLQLFGFFSSACACIGVLIGCPMRLSWCFGRSDIFLEGFFWRGFLQVSKGQSGWVCSFDVKRNFVEIGRNYCSSSRY